jgi:hypothetical protein
MWIALGESGAEGQAIGDVKEREWKLRLVDRQNYGRVSCHRRGKHPYDNREWYCESNSIKLL